MATDVIELVRRAKVYYRVTGGYAALGMPFIKKDTVIPFIVAGKLKYKNGRLTIKRW